MNQRFTKFYPYQDPAEVAAGGGATPAQAQPALDVNQLAAMVADLGKNVQSMAQQQQAFTEALNQSGGAAPGGQEEDLSDLDDTTRKYVESVRAEARRSTEALQEQLALNDFRNLMAQVNPSKEEMEEINRIYSGWKKANFRAPSGAPASPIDAASMVLGTTRLRAAMNAPAQQVRQHEDPGVVARPGRVSLPVGLPDLGEAGAASPQERLTSGYWEKVLDSGGAW